MHADRRCFAGSRYRSKGKRALQTVSAYTARRNLYAQIQNDSFAVTDAGLRNGGKSIGIVLTVASRFRVIHGISFVASVRKSARSLQKILYAHKQGEQQG